MKKAFTGINIQYPISELIVDGRKSIETRTYPIPKKYIGKELLLIETPGKSGKFKARAVAIIRFGESFPYASEGSFYKDVRLHCVTPESPWAWQSQKPKWGWPIVGIQRIQPQLLKKRGGIKFTTNISLVWRAFSPV